MVKCFLFKDISGFKCNEFAGKSIEFFYKKVNPDESNGLEIVPGFQPLDVWFRMI